MTNNQKDLTFRWVAGALLSIVTIMGAAWASNITTRIERVECALERIARVEAILEDVRTIVREKIHIDTPRG